LNGGEAARPRILQVFSEYVERGGEADSVSRISASLEAELEVHHCFFSNADWKGPERPSVFEQARWMFANPTSVRALRESQRDVKADAWLVHNVFPVGSAAVYREAARLGVPILQYLHNYRPFSINGYLWAGSRITEGTLPMRYLQEVRHAAWQNSRLKTAYFGAVLSLTRALGWWDSIRAWIAISEFVRERFIEFGVPAERIFMLRHFWRCNPAPVRDTPGEHYLFLGRLIEAKGVSVLFDAWKILERELGTGCPRLIIAGAGPLEASVRHRAKATRTIQFVGALRGQEKRRTLLAARAVVVPSLWWEPLGMVVYEAYDAAKPVLSAASGGLTETVVHGKTGFVHSPGDAEQLACDVMQLERNPERRVQMGQEGRLWLEQNAAETEWRSNFRSIVESVL
jgi:glycosyltransferase involved in cell wall biosynthesis